MNLFIGQANRIEVEIESKSVKQCSKGSNELTAFCSIRSREFRD